jgi:hypothetical protein
VNSFSFDPEDDPVVCEMVQTYAQQAAARRAAAEAERAEKERAADRAANAPASPRAARLKREREKEARLAAKRKFAEIASGIARLAGKVSASAETREALSRAADRAAEDAANAERRRLETLAGRSVRDVNVAHRRAGPAPFDRRVLYTGSHTTPFAMCTSILKDFCRRISPPSLRFQSPPSTPFNSD